jgi:hypothetical protein
MPERDLHIAAYDVSEARRLREALNVLKGYRVWRRSWPCGRGRCGQRRDFCLNVCDKI